MKVIVLAAGYATRLYPLTKDKPKALLNVGKKLLLDHLMDKIESITDVDEIIVVTNSRFFKAFRDWAKESKRSKPIRVLDDGTSSNDNRLGAIGDLQFALKTCRVAHDILVLASDNLFEESLDQFVKHAQAKGKSASIGIFDIRDPKVAAGRYGVIEVDPEFRITRIEEKPQEPKTTYVSMGVYYFPKDMLGLTDEYMQGSDKQDAPGHYATWLLDKVPVYGSLFKGKWYDIGSLDQLEEASRAYNP